MSRINIEDSLFNDPRMEVLMRRLGRELAIGHFVYISKLAQRYFVEGEKIPKKIWDLSDFPKDFIDVGMVEEFDDGYYLRGSEEHFSWIIAKKENGKKGGRPSKNNDIKKATGKLSESYKNPPTPTPTPTPTNNINIQSGNPTICEEVINYLNKKTNKNFRSTTKETQRFINARVKEGYSLQDFKKVIDVKTTEWLDDKKFNKYLRPSTLFKGGHFEDYLNHTEVKKPESTEQAWEKAWEQVVSKNPPQKFEETPMGKSLAARRNQQ